MTGGEVLVGLGIVVGLAGILIPFLPGSATIAAAVLVWALVAEDDRAWGFFAAVAAILLVGAVVKYLVPGKRLKDAGVPLTTQLVGGVAGLVGFFVIPVVGIVVGFVLGVYVAERARVGARAWASTKAALRAVGLSILIELLAGLAAAGVWLAGALTT